MKPLFLFTVAICMISGLVAQSNPREAEFYKIETLPIPSDIVLEVGGMTFNDRDQLAVCTRRGEVWQIESPYAGSPRFQRYAHGLHEPLGIAWTQGQYYVTQRGELTRLKDLNNDNKADRYETVYSWPLSGNYHEYSYGPLIMPGGDMILTLNLGWAGKGVSWAPWRGWMIQVNRHGEMTPIATGFRSPAGFGFNKEGAIFYAENQGDWVGSGRITHVEPGDFVGNPGGLKWASDPASPVKVREENVPDGQGTLYEAAQKVPGIKAPAVWFPHTLMGISTSDIKTIPDGNAFGPFEGQMLVGDQGHSKVMRVQLEYIDGVWQGICFPFLEGFSSGVLRLLWGKNGTLFVGMTSRGWAATGEEDFGIQRVKWTGKMPFEMKAVYAKPDGFEIEFTRPADAQTASDPRSYNLTSFTYNYHHIYGSPVIDQQPCEVVRVELSPDRTRARLYVAGIRKGYVHEIKAEGVQANGQPLLHHVGYYTLNRIPQGTKMQMDHSTHQTEVATADVSYDPAKYFPAMPADWGGKADQTVVIGTLPGLKFDNTEIAVRAGTKIRLEFNNPDDMQHNLVIGKPGSVEIITQLSLKLGLTGSNKGYIPETDQILVHTSLLQPHSSETIYFRAPAKPGVYDFLCTYPGHAFVMRGKLKVN
ncbi:MAG: plastocyanin/azurin family copper-binding protein [Bacteroidia bacterium]